MVGLCVGGVPCPPWRTCSRSLPPSPGGPGTQQHGAQRIARRGRGGLWGEGFRGECGQLHVHGKSLGSAST